MGAPLSRLAVIGVGSSCRCFVMLIVDFWQVAPTDRPLCASQREFCSRCVVSLGGGFEANGLQQLIQIILGARQE